MTAQEVLREATARYGFLSEADVQVLAADAGTRLTPVLVRCGGGRFTCPVQDVAHFIRIIERDAQASDGALAIDTDYVRDVSLVSPVGGGR